MVDTEGVIMQFKYARTDALGVKQGVLSEGCNHTVQGLGDISVSAMLCTGSQIILKIYTAKQYAMATAQCFITAACHAGR